jgi:hypothetical protein
MAGGDLTGWSDFLIHAVQGLNLDNSPPRIFAPFIGHTDGAYSHCIGRTDGGAPCSKLNFDQPAGVRISCPL